MAHKPLSSVICKVNLSINQAKEMYLLSKDDETVIQNFVLQRIHHIPSTSSQVRPQVTNNANMEGEGRRVDAILTRNGRVSRRVTEL